MKNLAITLCFVLLSIGINAQTCLPGNTVFASQSQIDAFPTNYPGCTQIIGTLFIFGGSPGDITNLNAFSAVTSIGGGLYFQDNDALTSLAGLDALTTIGDELSFQSTYLTSLTGLGALTTIVGDLFFRYNDALTSLTGLDALTTINALEFTDNAALTSLTGLGALTTIVGGQKKFIISNNDALTSLTGLNALTSVGGEFEIKNNAALTSLTGLDALSSIGKHLYIWDNDALTSLTGLGALTSIGEGLDVDNHAALTSLTGLDALSSIGGLVQIRYNSALTGITGLNALTSIGGGLNISNNGALTAITGLNALTTTGGHIEILANSALSSLTGLNALNSIGGDLKIEQNDALTDLTGLDNIDHTTITELRIENSTMLSLCEVQSICDYLAIPSNPATISGNATGCATRSEVEAACLALPIELVSFTGKSIENRVILSWQSATEQNNDYFQIGNGQDGRNFKDIGTVKSSGNSTDMKSYTFIHPNPFMGVNYYRLKQVDFDRKYEYSKTISINIESDEISIFPNPTTGIIEVQGKNSDEGIVRLTDNVGRLIKTQKLSDYKQIDIGNLPNGMYFIYILTESRSTVKRVIKQ